MSTPFTPGPWKAEAYNGRMGSLISYGDISEGESIGVVYGMHDADQAKANARLVAAAPEMYEALKMLVADCADYEAWQRPCLAFDNAKAALAKAVQP